MKCNYCYPFSSKLRLVLWRDTSQGSGELYNTPGVLTIYTGKPEIPVGRSNSSRHSLGKLQKIWALICGVAIFLLF